MNTLAAVLLGICIQQCRDDLKDGGYLLKDQKTCRCYIDHKIDRLPDIELHIYPMPPKKDIPAEPDDRSYMRYEQ